VFPKCNRKFGTVYRCACVIGVYFELIGVVLCVGVGVHCHPCTAIPLALQRLKIKYLILLILRVGYDQSMTNRKAVQPLSTCLTCFPSGHCISCSDSDVDTKRTLYRLVQNPRSILSEMHASQICMPNM
jgi:hypothetical protein